MDSRKQPTEYPEYFKSINTKIAPDCYKKIVKLCRKRRVPIYELLQNMCDVIVRYMSDKQNLTPSMERAMNIFEHLTGWNGDGLTFANITTDPTITEALYIIKQPKKKGARVVLVERPWMGEFQEEVNVQRIFERIVCTAYPDRYRQLRRIGGTRGAQSILETLDALIADAVADEDNAEIRGQFEDAEHLEDVYNNASVDRHPQKKGYKVDMDKMPSFFNF